MIVKKKIQSSNADTNISVDEVLASSEGAASQSAYNEAIHHIHEAISCLGSVAKADSLAKESIANLSVVLLDLQNPEQ